jgi:glyoxylase I family protein
MEVRGYHHINLIVDDLEKAEHFYREILGLQKITERPIPFPGFWLKLRNSELHISPRPSGPPKGWGHIAIHVANFDELVAKLKNAGVEYHDWPAVRGQKRGGCFDPAGNEIEIVDGPPPTAGSS